MFLLLFLSSCAVSDGTKTGEDSDQSDQSDYQSDASDKSEVSDSDTGDTGNTGNTGDTGNTGNTGMDDKDEVDDMDTGDTGNSGDSGNSGDTGDSGDSGDSGDTGGVEGTDGYNGDFSVFRFGGEQKDFSQNIVTTDGKTIYVAGDTSSGLDTFTSFDPGKISAFVAEIELNDSDQMSVKWVREIRTDGSLAQESGRAITLDNDGNILVAGTTYGDLDDEWEPIVPGDVFAAKLDKNGTVLWLRQWGSTDSEEYSFGVDCDSGGNVYVTGHGQGAINEDDFAGAYDCFITKISSTGTIEWSRQIGSEDLQFCYSVVADNSGNVFVAGYTFDQVGDESHHGTEGDPDTFLAKIKTSDGTIEWIRQYGTDEGDMAFAMRFHNNMLYIGGMFQEWNNVMAVDPDDGRIDWNAKWYDDQEEVVRDLAVGEKGIYVSGLSFMFPNSENDQDIYVAALDFSGNIKWHDFPATESDDWSYGIDAGGGKIFVTGTTSGMLEGDGTALDNEDGVVLFTDE